MKVNLQVKDVMSRNVLKIFPTESVMQVVLKMKEKNIGSAIVTDGESVIGIVTERDLAFKVIPDSRDPERTSVEEIMHSPVTTIGAEMDITEAADLMAKNNFRRLPVLDGNRLVGIVTENDIAAVEPDLVRLLQHLLASKDDSSATDLISKYYQEKKAREEFERIKKMKKDTEGR
jgi:CBS domain-containing protein